MSESNQTTKHNQEDLLKLFNEAESCDKTTFAEMRSNILLIAGEHYAKKNSKFYSRIRDNKDLSNEQKIRLTKNHVQKIQKIYSNQIISYAPGVSPAAHNENELQDQKAAELAKSVWMHGRQINRFSEKRSSWADEFTGIGEVHAKLFFNPNAGEFKGYEQEVDDQGNPQFKHPETGELSSDPISLHPETSQIVQHEPVASSRPVFSGRIEFETLYGFNLLRAPEASTFEDSPYLIIRKMTDKKEAESLIPSDDPDFEEKKKQLEASSKEAFVVFDQSSGTYRNSKDQIMLLEYYFRPGIKYPNGYFYITTSTGYELVGDELPFGIFPIRSAPFEKAPTLPRGISPVRTMRPYQIEINRAASKIAEHQITLGDDKLIYQMGGKISEGKAIPGVRGIAVSGAAPTVLPGRSGEQYLNYLNSQIDELYNVMMVQELEVEKNGQLDPYAMMFRSASQKQRFSRNTERFEQFLTDVCETYLELARNYLSEEDMIPAVGKREMVNISEFKNGTKLDYLIKLEPQTDDIESKMGRQLTLNHLLQYASNKLEKEDIGKIYRLMPYGNDEEISSDLTIDYDNATNMILALDRGEQPQANMRDTKEYMIKRLTTRTRMADFKQLASPVQQNYDALINQYEQMISQEQQQIQAAEADFIPTGGYLVVCDFYVSDPQDPSKTHRARLPYEAVQWLVNRLEQQGSSLQQLESMQSGTLAEMARMHNQTSQQGQAQTPGHGMPGGAGMGQRNVPQGVGSSNGNAGISQPGNKLSGVSFNPAVLGHAASPTGSAIPGAGVPLPAGR